MFGHRFFGARFFGPRYFGPADERVVLWALVTPTTTIWVEV